MAQNDRKEFTFISEQIKKKPFYRRKWFLQAVSGMVLALSFGAAAGLTFSIVYPWAKGQFGEPEKPTQIVVVQEESETDDLEAAGGNHFFDSKKGSAGAESSQGSKGEDGSGSESESRGEDGSGSESENKGEDGSGSESESRGEDGSGSESESRGEDRSGSESENKGEGNAEREPDKGKDITEYQQLYGQMREIADTASGSMVTVSGYSTETDWFNEVYEHMSETSGLILRMDSNWIYVLTSSKVIEGAGQIAVTFEDGETAEASVRKQDPATEMAVLEIPLKSVRKKTRKSIETISMKGVSTVEKGEPVIAVGSPLGYTDSLAFGMITSVTACQGLDNEYRVISTDIVGNENSYGILLNLEGNIVGILSKKFSQDTEQRMVSALRIADINALLELLMENQPIPYVGITGKEVEEAPAQRFQMPRGVYVRQVETDSPAMYAGIQAADIITAINGEAIHTVREYAKSLKRYRQGEAMRMTVRRKSIEGYAEVDVMVLVGTR